MKRTQKNTQKRSLPPFVSTERLKRITGRSRLYLTRRMPPQIALNASLKGWPAEVVSKWLDEHPEAIVME